MPRGGPVYRYEVAQQPRQENSLTASARAYSTSSASRMVRKTGRATNSRAWQNDLWDYYDTVPEFRFGVDWVGNLLSKAVIEVRYKGEPTTNQVALDALASLFGGSEGQAEMLRLLGINFTLAGEAWIIGTPDKNGIRADDWQVVAAVEVTGESTNRLSVEGEELPPDALPIRIWKAHPRRSDEPNSPSRAIMPVLSEITMLTKVISAQGDSRLTSAGILWVPSEMELPSVPVTQFLEDGDDPTTSQQMLDGSDGLYNRLIQIASIAIENRHTAAAQVPLVVAAPGEFLEKIQKTEFWSGFDEHAKTLRDEARSRIGIGMDMPPEVITGTADVNHWGSWQIEEASIKSHTEPLLDLIINSVTVGYLHNVLRAEDVADWENYSFFANTAALRMRPNRSKEAIELWDRGALSSRTLLVENGFDPDVDSPDDAEKVLWLYAKVAGGSTTPDQVAAALAHLGVKVPAPIEESVETQEARPTRSLTEHPNRDIPAEEDSEAGGAIQASAAFVIDGVLLASEAWVRQALRRAGNRLKNKVGPGVKTAAPEIYLSVSLSHTEARALLLDAWDDLDSFSYPGVNAHRLKQCLNDYTLTLLRLQKQHTREGLARHLLLELADQAA